METQVGIYIGTTLQGVIEASAPTAWKAARSYVRSLAHACGVSGATVYERTPGRFAISVGYVRAVSMVRQ